MQAAKVPLVKIGCCGFGVAQAKYFDSYSTVEIQHTFYEPPKLETLAKWRQAAPDDFEFVIKAWQLITHSSKSPTFRRLKRQLSASELKDCGEFKNSGIVKEALETTLASAEVLRSSSIVFQCPASFTASGKHVDNLRSFFSSFKRPKGMRFYWEPRGDWEPELVKELCNEVKIFHAVDPFLNFTVTPENPYFRLHGIGGWRHKYSLIELSDLEKRLHQKWRPEGIDGEPAYVFFNNVSMNADAARFEKLLSGED